MKQGATSEGTTRYRQQRAKELAEGHFREAHGLWLSSIGLGTYLGDPDEETDQRYRHAIARALQLGCNVIDTAINYRHQHSERCVGEALAALFTDGAVSRGEVVVATKGGFIPFEGEPPSDPRAYIIEKFIRPGIAEPEEFAGAMHCMGPGYLRHQLDQSLENLGLDSVDVYYVHNPETQLQSVSRDEFRRRLRRAFAALEEAVAAGKIGWYGTATWNGYRRSPEAGDYLSLAEVVEVAREAGGPDHHFGFIQLPYNLGMPEAFTNQNQTVNGQEMSTLQAVQELGITAMASASLLQSRLTADLPASVRDAFTDVDADAQRAIQFVRSTPGLSTALVGMSRVTHVEENLQTAKVEPAAVEVIAELFSEPG